MDNRGGAQVRFSRYIHRTAVLRRLIVPAAALLTAVLALSIVGQARAQADEVLLVNADRDFVERKKGGEFIARPVFDRRIERVYYGVRDADTGDWITPMYRVIGGEKRLRDGWEYSWEYPALDAHPDLNPGRSYLLVMLAGAEDGTKGTFHSLIPVHQPTGLWDRILGALNPARWARAFAGWVIEGVHGALCGVVERATGADAANCGGG